MLESLHLFEYWCEVRGGALELYDRDKIHTNMIRDAGPCLTPTLWSEHSPTCKIIEIATKMQEDRLVSLKF